MKLSYTVTEKAYRDFNIHFILHTAYLQRQARLIRFLPLLFCIMPWVLEALTDRVLPIWYSVGLVALGLLWVLFYPAYYRLVLKKRFERYIKEGNGKEFLGDHSLELLDDRMMLKDKTNLLDSVVKRL